jgi:hypothetical protein
MAMIAATADLVLSLRRIFPIEPILFPTIISPPVTVALAFGTKARNLRGFFNQNPMQRLLFDARREQLQREPHAGSGCA